MKAIELDDLRTVAGVSRTKVLSALRNNEGMGTYRAVKISAIIGGRRIVGWVPRAYFQARSIRTAQLSRKREKRRIGGLRNADTRRSG
jgi:hypothetical protein